MMRLLRRALAVGGGVVALVSLVTFAVADGVPLTVRDVNLRFRSAAPDRYYPEVAQKAGVEGSAEVLCKIAPGGGLEACQITAEEPKGCRFGEALVRMVSYMEASQRAKDGTRTNGRQLQFRTSFKLPTNLHHPDVTDVERANPASSTCKPDLLSGDPLAGP
jgi:TonB family protein